MANSWPPLAVPERRSGRALSAMEWLALSEDEPGELVSGELEEEKVPDAVHELAVAWLIRTARDLAWAERLRFRFQAEAGDEPEHRAQTRRQRVLAWRGSSPKAGSCDGAPPTSSSRS